MHTNCLAALANMSSQFRFLHPYVSQRLISLFETLAKKHSKLEVAIRAQPSSTSTAVNISPNGSVESCDLVKFLSSFLFTNSTRILSFLPFISRFKTYQY